MRHDTTPHSLLTLALPLFLGLLHGSCKESSRWPAPQPVGLTVEAREGVHGTPLANTTVTLIEVEHEWNGCVCQSPFEVFGVSDHTGQVRFESEDFADSEVGFIEDGHGHAVLQGRPDRDEARVALLVTKHGYRDQLIRILLSNERPDRLAIVVLEPCD